MVEIENLSVHQNPPDGDNFVLIVRTPNGTYLEVSAGNIVASRLGPYATDIDAEAAAQRQAELLGLDIIYAKGA